MTSRKTTLALKKIEAIYESGYILEALFQNYYLNLNLIKFICTKSELTVFEKDKKIKKIFEALTYEVDTNKNFKSIISKSNIKILKVWAQKMDVFFKASKHSYPTNAKLLFLETQKITSVLNISAQKIFVQP